LGLGHYEQAVVHAERSLTLHQSRGDEAGEALALHQSAMAWQGIGDHEKAAELCEKSLHIGRDFGHPPEMAATLDTLGAVSLSLGQAQQAAAHWRAALAIFEEYGDHRAADLRERVRSLGTEKAGSS
jgi:tetratricopeptide (TPR) repeat protein